MKNLIILQVTNLDTSSIQGTSTESFIDIALKGGWVMLPIVILSFIAVYIFFERWFAIKKAARVDQNFMNRIKDYIIDGKVDSTMSMQPLRMWVALRSINWKEDYPPWPQWQEELP